MERIKNISLISSKLNKSQHYKSITFIEDVTEGIDLILM